MDQVYQLQQQLQRLRQEISDISQVCNALQQSEQTNSMQLQQLQQKEVMATQGLRRIQQAANSLSQDINQISSIAQQMAGQMQTQRTFASTYPPLTTGISPYAGAGMLSQTTGFGGQSGTFAGQFGNLANQTGTFAGQTGIYSGQAGMGALASQTGLNQIGATFPASSQFSYATNLAGGQNTGMFASSTPYASQNPSTNTLLQSTYSPYQANQFGFR
ncbi:hypothetical protein DCCM_3144 [Desulfocucumis palustris]|uniref:Uncharacterized protein n=1 Tax=Desulfocucumis palustris TaxID=1898651 RepID=A0A2L2XE98_9FIRM|nr:hypothetical protein [Desulfocucumis palustris]GBF34033.1 hypothetical protein DCCM_3144 [Desulfocucumis palustris]